MENNLQNLQEQDWFQRIMKSEGGLNRNEPASVGGISYAGISQKTFYDWFDAGKCQIEDAPRKVVELAGDAIGTEWEKASPLEIPAAYGVRVDVIVAFYQDYFSMARLDVVPEALRYMHADFFTNAMYTANKVLQRMCGFQGKSVDGILGPASREYIGQLDETFDNDDLIMGYHDEKLKHYESIKETNPALYDTNIKGWRKRAQHILSELQHYFHDDEPTTSALLEDEIIPVVFEVETPVEASQDPVTEITATLRISELKKYETVELLDELRARLVKESAA